jgi:hypothetical protein
VVRAKKKRRQAAAVQNGDASPGSGKLKLERQTNQMKRDSFREKHGKKKRSSLRGLR